MKTLLITTAIIAATSMGAYAQDTNAASGTDGNASTTATAPAAADSSTSADASMGANFKTMMQPGELQASKLIGMDVYSTDGKPVPASAKGVPDNWQDIGEVGDIVLTKDGKVDAVLVDVGGFLGMGEHRVGLAMSGIKMVSDDKTTDDPNDFFLVVDQSKDSLKNAPVYKTPEDQKQASATTGNSASTAATGASATDNSSMASNSDTSATAPADSNSSSMASTSGSDNAAAGDSSKMADNGTAASTDANAGSTAAAGGAAMTADSAAAPAGASKDGFQPVDQGSITAENLKDADVYGPKNSKIGSVSKLVLDPQGKVSKAVVDVGGFLGMGAKSVALTTDQMHIMKKKDGDTLRVYVSMTEDQLKKMPAYKS